MKLPPQLASYPVVVEVPVQWGEMDAHGHVHNAVYFRYFESARVEYLAKCGFLESYQTEHVGVILHSTECRFLRRLHYPDTVLVGARAVDVADDRFTMDHLAVSLTANEVVAEGRAVIVSFDYATGRKAPVPAAVRNRMERMEQQ